MNLPEIDFSQFEYPLKILLLDNEDTWDSMLQTLFENYGSLVHFDHHDFWCFWEPKALAKAKEEKLRRLKMGYRAKFLIKVSTPFAKGETDELAIRKMSVEEQEKILLSLYGIGPASAGYMWKNLAVHYVWEDLWWKRTHENISWLEELIRL